MTGRISDTTAKGATAEPSSRRRLVVAAATALAIMVTTAVVLVTRDDRPEATVGAVYSRPADIDPLPDLGEVVLPWARLEMGVAPPTDELPEVRSTPADIKAPDDGSFVRVGLTWPDAWHTSFYPVRYPLTSVPSVVLRADGRDYEINDAEGGLGLDPNDLSNRGPQTLWVAVEGRPSELELRVTVEGETQVVKQDGSVDLGRAAGLDVIPAPELATPEGVDCGTMTRLDRTDWQLRLPTVAEAQCRIIEAQRTPYVDGLGWAEPGREFVAVTAVTERSLSLGRPGERHWTQDPTTTIRMAGAETVSTETGIDLNTLNRGTGALVDLDFPQMWIFEVAEDAPLGDLSVVVSTETERDTEVRLGWTVLGSEL